MEKLFLTKKAIHNVKVKDLVSIRFFVVMFNVSLQMNLCYFSFCLPEHSALADEYSEPKIELFVEIFNEF